jgi:acetyl-CoA carboxylase biotin carboxylase subunit
MQRRHQKVIEEAPGPHRPQEARATCEAAARLIKAANYSGAATVEFLMDDKQNFYMLEVNTRVQVEHPVTEMITGVDIVKMSILVASGEPLPSSRRTSTIRGHAMECRINAEDPDTTSCRARADHDLRSPGRPGRAPRHARRHRATSVPPNYDSMIGKLIVHAD